ncbi:MAG: zinc-dependent peptidase [Gammaproteobacteria bacterium]|jgi:Mlc titration factor MtfA (ptsG expression regulator)
MFNFLQNWFDRRIIKRSTISEEEWTAAFDALPLLTGLSGEEQQRLRELAILFMHDKAFEGAAGLTVTRPMALLIALQACLPILNLGLENYDGWVSVIVYPAGFAPERASIDEAGVVHRGQSHLSGEAWQRGPVIIAWDDAETAGVIDGHNLVIHEFAHKLDMQNGVANGFPPMHVGMSVDKWVVAFTDGFAHFQQHCQHGRFHGFDCYAATSPAEFFAVFSELFFERPALLRQHYAAIYEQLCQYYRQDPSLRLA